MIRFCHTDLDFFVYAQYAWSLSNCTRGAYFVLKTRVLGYLQPRMYTVFCQEGLHQLVFIRGTGCNTISIINEVSKLALWQVTVRLCVSHLKVFFVLFLQLLQINQHMIQDENKIKSVLDLVFISCASWRKAGLLGQNMF